MLLMRLIAPRKLPVQKSKWGIWHKIFYFLLKIYMPFYMRGAYSETLTFGDITIMHTLSDVWFEGQLVRFGLYKPKQTGEASVVSGKIIRRYHRYTCFRWTETLSVVDGDGKCEIIRDRKLSVLSDVRESFKLCRIDGKLYSLKFVGHRNAVKPKKIHIEKDSGTVDVPPSPKHKIRLKDEVGANGQPADVVGNVLEIKGGETPDVFIKHSGFEENDIF